jgi:hypothetical protein
MEIVPGTIPIGDWVGPTVGLDAEEREKYLLSGRKVSGAGQIIARLYTD